MAKVKSLFYCTECGNESLKWQGRCSARGGGEKEILRAVPPGGRLAQAAAHRGG